MTAYPGGPSHTGAIADTGDGYEITRGWHVTCLWCPWSATRRTKVEAEAAYHRHERQALDDEYAATQRVSR
jgi:hypothetical protein